MALSDLNSYLEQNAPTVAEEPSFADEAIDFGRTLGGQGALLGFGDELEAKLRTIGSDRPYEDIVAEVRADIASFAERNPGTAITAEIIGAIAPTAAMYMSGIGAPSAAVNTARVGSKMMSMGQKVKSALPLAMGESGTYAVGKGEQGISEDIKEFPEGAAWGALGTVAMTPVLHGGQVGLDKLMNLTRSKFGDRASNVVVKKIQQAMTETGKSIGEIVADIQSGRLFAENKTLSHIISNIFNEGGETKSFIADQTQKRAFSTRQDLKQTMSESALGQKNPDSAYATYLKGQGDTLEGSSDAYKGAYKNAEELPNEIMDDMLEGFNRIPKGQLPDFLDNINTTAGNVVPVFKLDKAGRLIWNKKPTLEDAEEVYKHLRDHRTGTQGADNNLKQFAHQFKEKLNKLSPQLNEARLGFRMLKTNEEAFEQGTKSLTKNIDEIKYQFDELMAQTRSGSKDTARLALGKLKALRAGVMNAVSNKLSGRGGAAAIAGDEDMKIPAIIRIVFPNKDMDEIIRKADIADTAQVMQNKVSAGGTGGGSDSAGRIQQQTKDVAEGLAQGTSPVYLFAKKAIDFAINKIMPQMDDKARMEVAKILYSKNPKLVEEAITGSAESGVQLQQLVNDVITKMGYFGMPGAVATQPNEGILDQFGLAK